MTAPAIPGNIDRRMAVRVSIPAALLFAVAGVCAATSCAKTDDGTCADQVRALGLDDSNATGLTVREIGSRFHVGDVWSCALSWAALGSQPTAEGCLERRGGRRSPTPILRQGQDRLVVAGVGEGSEHRRRCDGGDRNGAVR